MAIAELRLRNNISLKSCGIAIVEVLPSSCGIVIADSKKSCAFPPLQNSDTPISANTLFLKIGKSYTPFSARHQFFRITNNLGWSSGKTFLQNPRWCSGKINYNVYSAPAQKHLQLITTTSDPLEFRWTVPLYETQHLNKVGLLHQKTVQNGTQPAGQNIKTCFANRG